MTPGPEVQEKTGRSRSCRRRWASARTPGQTQGPCSSLGTVTRGPSALCLPSPHWTRRPPSLGTEATSAPTGHGEGSRVCQCESVK